MIIMGPFLLLFIIGEFSFDPRSLTCLTSHEINYFLLGFLALFLISLNELSSNLSMDYDQLYRISLGSQFLLYLPFMLAALVSLICIYLAIAYPSIRQVVLLLSQCLSEVTVLISMQKRYALK